MPSKQDEPSCQLVEGWVAGTFYHDANRLTQPLVVGQSLRLRAEPDNPKDPLAVAILTNENIKLGYVPRRLNAGIARRLAAGFDLRVEVTRFTREGDHLGVRFRILSLTPGDRLDPPPERPAPAPRPWPIHRQPPYQLNAIANALREARTKLAMGERHAAFAELDSAMNWALDLWGLRHPGELKRHCGWSEQFAAFMEKHPDPLRRRIGLLTLVRSALFPETEPASAIGAASADAPRPETLNRHDPDASERLMADLWA